MSGELTTLQKVQVDLGEKPDDAWGPKCEAALEREKEASRQRRTGGQATGGLGDGTWPWKALIEGDDIVVPVARMTCFGGSNDPQDSGATASGISTKANPNLEAVSLPMDGRMFPGLSKAEHAALDGSPIPRIPFKTIVRVTVKIGKRNEAGEQETKTFDWPVIDLGPGKRTGNALDLTVAAARRIDPKASATNFEASGSYRVIGAARFVPKKAPTASA